MAEEDIIFGKNRHMFGGVEPSNMLIFEAVENRVQSGAVRINVQLPEDTVVEGQTLCSVAGAVIRRKYDGYPKDEFDGDLVVNLTDKTPSTIQDFPIPSDSTYTACFYAAFPYTTQGVYNRNTNNRTSINRPENLESFTVLPFYSGTKIYGRFVDEGDDGTVAGVAICRSTTSYPTCVTDDNLVRTFTYPNDPTKDFGFHCEDHLSDDVGKTYYYTAFTYNSDGVYNYDGNSKSKVTLTGRYGWLYGYDLDTNDPTPTTRVTYPEDVDNSYFTPVSHTGYNQLGTQSSVASMSYEFSYGSWTPNSATNPTFPGFMPRPCMLKYDGTVGEYLNPNDYSKTISGEASNVANSDYAGNAMMEWPKIWTKRWEDEDGIYHFRCSSEQIDEDYDCWCNYDKDNNQIDHFYTAIYPTSLYGGKARSISGANIASSGYDSSNFCEQAKKNGDGWFVEAISDRLLIQDLLVLLGKSTDTQTVFGGLRVGTTDVTGKLDKCGLFCEYGADVKIFGMEHWWGCTCRAIHNWRFLSGNQYIKITPGTHDGSSIAKINSGTANTISGLANLTGVVPTWSTGTRYIKKMKTLPYGRLPYTDGSGTASTYECDMMFPIVSDTVYYGGTTSLGRYDTANSEVSTAEGAFSVYRHMYNDKSDGLISALSYRVNSTSY